MSIHSKRLFCFLISIIMIICMISYPHCDVVYADQTEPATWPQAPDIYGTSAILMDADTGAVLYAQNPNERLYPASITKIITGLLAIENLNLEDTITYTDDILNSLPGDAAKLGLLPGETASVRDTLYALLLRSANEAAVALSLKIAGSEQAFGTMMTERAKAAGALDTNFSNSTGLHDVSHYTTAYDMAMITKSAMENTEFSTIWSAPNYTLNPTNVSEAYRIWNRHPLLVSTSEYYYPYAIGGKTGYTDEAGRTLVTAAEKDGLTLICVIMKSDEAHIFTDTMSLFEYGFQNFIKVNIKDTESRFGTVSSSIPVIDKLYGTNSSIFSLSNDSIVIPSTVSLSDIPYTLEFLDTPEQNVVARIHYEYNGNYLGSASLMMNLSNMTGSTDLGPERNSSTSGQNSSIQETTPINIYVLTGSIIGGILLIFILVKILKYRHKMQQKRKHRMYY